MEDWRRTNVALTRARRALIVIAHPPTLSSDPTWGAYLEWLTQHGRIVEPRQLGILC